MQRRSFSRVLRKSMNFTFDKTCGRYFSLADSTLVKSRADVSAKSPAGLPLFRTRHVCVVMANLNIVIRISRRSNESGAAAAAAANALSRLRSDAPFLALRSRIFWRKKPGSGLCAHVAVAQ